MILPFSNVIFSVFQNNRIHEANYQLMLFIHKNVIQKLLKLILQNSHSNIALLLEALQHKRFEYIIFK